jgi:UDP-N-acetyl-D-mannosaminuronate dehydrogenase
MTGMVKKKVLVIGLGEVGYPLLQLLTECGKFEVYGLDIDKKKMDKLKQEPLPAEIDVMHICYPCIDQNKFVKTTADYIKRFKSKLVIINSTVPPTTTFKVHKVAKCNAAHSPVRGVHGNDDVMKRDILFWTKYIGGIDTKSSKLAQKHFEDLGLKTKTLHGPVETELAKLFETTYRAWMIACFQEMHRISRHFGANFDEVVDMLEDVHKVRFNKPPHFPGVIGGHCLIQNTELLLKSYDSEFLRLILKSNELRKEEIKDESIQVEVQKIKKRVKALEEKLQKTQKSRTKGVRKVDSKLGSD